MPSKEAGDPWGVRVIPENGKVRFETYRVKQGRGPNGTEVIPPGHRRDQRDGLLRYGITHYLDMFTPRQLLGHLTLIETLNQLKPEILAELGAERGRAVVTYLQFAIDKGVDYNSRQTR